jgi:hypothetical protein
MRHITIRPLLTLALLLPAMMLVAQDEELPQLSGERLKEIKAQRTAYITTKLGLSSAEAQVFWPVYNEYDEARETLRKGARERMRSMTAGGATLSEGDANKLLAQRLSDKEAELGLERTYQARFVKTIGAVKTVELHKAERDFQREVLRRFRERMEERRDGRNGPQRGRP